MMNQLDDIDIPDYNENKNVPYPQWLMYSRIVPRAICENIIEEAKKLPSQKGTVFSSTNKQIISNIRKTQIRWITKDMKIFNPLFNFIDTVIRKVNEGFRVNCNMVPSIQFTEYLEPGYHYNWHHDVDWNRSDGKSRKMKLHCATECLRNSLTRRSNPCYCFSDCKMLNTNVECYNTNKCNCNNRCEVLKQSIKIKLDKPL